MSGWLRSLGTTNELQLTIHTKANLTIRQLLQTVTELNTKWRVDGLIKEPRKRRREGWGKRKREKEWEVIHVHGNISLLLMLGIDGLTSESHLLAFIVISGSIFGFRRSGKIKGNEVLKYFSGFMLYFFPAQSETSKVVFWIVAAITSWCHITELNCVANSSATFFRHHDFSLVNPTEVNDIDIFFCQITTPFVLEKCILLFSHFALSHLSISFLINATG